MLKRLLLSVLLILSVSAFAQTEDEVAIRTLLEGIVAAERAGDVEAYLRYWASDSIQQFPNTPDAVGKEQIRSLISEFFSAGPVSVTLDIKEIVIEGSLAYIRLNAVVPSAAAEELTTNLRVTMMAVRQPDGRWQMWREMAF